MKTSKLFYVLLYALLMTSAATRLNAQCPNDTQDGITKLLLYISSDSPMHKDLRSAAASFLLKYDALRTLHDHAPTPATEICLQWTNKFLDKRCGYRRVYDFFRRA